MRRSMPHWPYLLMTIAAAVAGPRSLQSAESDFASGPLRLAMDAWTAAGHEIKSGKGTATYRVLDEMDRVQAETQIEFKYSGEKFALTFRSGPLSTTVLKDERRVVVCDGSAIFV